MNSTVTWEDRGQATVQQLPYQRCQERILEHIYLWIARRKAFVLTGPYLTRSNSRLRREVSAFSSFQSDDSTAFFRHHARRHSLTLLLCFFYKAWPTDPIGSSQEPRLHATIAIWGSVSSAQLCCCSVCIEFPGRKTAWDVWLHMILKEDVTTYQERLGSYLK